jgi:hypothetical protein
MTKISLGADYSFDRPGGAALKAAGVKSVGRYVPYSTSGTHGLDKEELKDLLDHGISIWFVHETTANRMLAGYEAGRVDARHSRNQLNGLGIHNSTPVYFAVDFDSKAPDLGPIVSYLDGAASEIGWGCVGVYGSWSVCINVAGLTPTKHFWQTYAWSGGRKFDRRSIYQYRNGQKLNGADIDYNECYGTDWGQWPPEEDVTKDEVVELINKLKDDGDLASTTDVLACVAQIVGSEKNTYSDTERVNKVRAAIRGLAVPEGTAGKKGT